MLDFWIGYASMVIGAIIIAVYIAYLRFRFERFLALNTSDEFWNAETDRATKIRHLFLPFAIYLISIGAIIYYYPRLSRAAIFFVQFDLNVIPELPMPLLGFAAFNLIFGAIVLSPILISFPGKAALKYISKVYALIFIIWLIIESDLIFYNLTISHLIPFTALLPITISILILPLLYIAFKESKAQQG